MQTKNNCMYTAAGQLVCTTSALAGANPNVEHFAQDFTEPRTMSAEWAPLRCTTRCRDAIGKWTGQWTNNLGWNQNTCGCYVFKELPKKSVKMANVRGTTLQSTPPLECKKQCLNYPDCKAVVTKNNQNVCYVVAKTDNSFFTDSDLTNNQFYTTHILQ